MQKVRFHGEERDVTIEDEFDNISCDCDHIAIVERDGDQITIVACSCNAVAKETFEVSS